MTFPVVQGTNTSSESGAVTSHAVALPSGIVAGELLIVFAVFEAIATPPAGWTKFCDLFDLADGGGYYAIATGSEGASVIFGTPSTCQSGHNSYRISGHAGAPTAGVDSDLASAADPPSLTPSWGSADTLWIAVEMHLIFGDVATVTGLPTNYTNLITVSGIFSPYGFALGSGRRNLAAASENPGVFPDSADSWQAATVAIAPAGASSLGAARSFGIVIG